MKRLLLLFSCALFAFTTVDGQEETRSRYFSFSAGWSFPASPATLGYESYTDSLGINYQYPIRGSLGTGVTNSLVFGISVSEHLTLESGLFAVWGRNLNVGANRRQENNMIVSDRIDRRIHSRGILVGMGCSDKLSSFEFGVHSYFAMGMFNRDHATYTYSNDATRILADEKGGVSFGWLSRVTVAYPFNESWSLGCELYYMLHTWSPTKGKIWRYYQNDVDVTNSLGDEELTYEFTYDYTAQNGTTFPQQQRLREVHPLHAAGVALFLQHAF